MRVLLIGLLLLLAGCADEKSAEGGDAEPTQEAEDDSPASVTADDAAGQPTSQGSASVNDTVENLVPVVGFSATEMEGVAPLLVNFTIDIQDDGAFTWEILVDGGSMANGTTSPAWFEHTFEAGQWNVTLNVTDGTHLVTDSIALMVDEGDPCAGVATQEPIKKSGNANGGAAHAGFYSTQEWDLMPCQTKMTVTHTYDTTGGDRDMRLFSPDGKEVMRSTDTAVIGEDGPLVVEDPALLAMTGTWKVQIYVEFGGPTAYDVDITFG